MERPPVPLLGMGASTKLLVCMVLSVAAFAARTPLPLGILTACNVGLVLVLRVPLSTLIREMRLFLGQTVIICILYTIRFGPIEGLGPGLTVSWQLFLAFLPGLTFVQTTPQSQVVSTLSRFMPGTWAFVLAACLRFMPLLLDEVKSVYEVQVMRGAKILPRDLINPKNWPDLVHCVFVPSVVQSLALAGEIATAARARDFGRVKKRTCWPGVAKLRGSNVS